MEEAVRGSEWQLTTKGWTDAHYEEISRIIGIYLHISFQPPLNQAHVLCNLTTNLRHIYIFIQIYNGWGWGATMVQGKKYNQQQPKKNSSRRVPETPKPRKRRPKPTYIYIYSTPESPYTSIVSLLTGVARMLPPPEPQQLQLKQSVLLLSITPTMMNSL